MALKADKRNLERNTIPEDICWESRDDVERLTNRQLRLYLRQEGLMVSGNKAQLVERILKHADGSVARTFDEDIEGDDESQPSMKVVHQATVIWSAASKFYLLIMQTYQK